jgi:hypothetical protein
MSYVSNHTADIGIRAKQRAALEAEQRAFIRRGGKITEVQVWRDGSWKYTHATPLFFPHFLEVPR